MRKKNYLLVENGNRLCLLLNTSSYSEEVIYDNIFVDSDIELEKVKRLPYIIYEIIENDLMEYCAYINGFGFEITREIDRIYVKMV